jgi:hypothetical protein
MLSSEMLPRVALARSSETPVPTRVTRLNVQEVMILYSHHRENLKSYMIGCFPEYYMHLLKFVNYYLNAMQTL